MKIAVDPLDKSFSNKYIERMVEAIICAYPDAQITSFPRKRKILSLRKYDYVWLNWFENLSAQNKFKDFFSKILTLLILKIMRIKIISTFHNREPHESKNSFLDRVLFASTFRLSNRIIVLSSDSNPILSEKFGSSILKKVKLIPHPTYDCIPKTSHDAKDNFSILFFGHLRPYKNIELILDVAKANTDINFTIAGQPLNREYKEELRQKADDIPNVTLNTSFLSSNEIDELIDRNTILLLPYNLRSSLNSGVVIHAICKGINMIVPRIGTVNQLENKDQIFSYLYETDSDHFKKINQMIELARNEYENNNDKFERRIEKLYNEVTSNQSPRSISKKIKQAFI